MLIDKLYKLREELHKNPEISFNEFKTSEILMNFISAKTNNIKEFTIYRPFLTSIIVEYSNGGKEPYIIFRADMDALSIEESASNKIVSENRGFMHACGHDLHMTILCGLISKVKEIMPKKNILFVFQPGEEGAGGAKGLISTGFFDKFEIKRAFALHVTDDYKTGEVASNGEVLFAIPREINFIFKGKSAHAAFPEKGNDALMAAADFLTSYETSVRKSVNPTEISLIHFGKMLSGTARNIVSEYAEIQGTARAFNMETMIKVTEVLTKIAKTSAEKFGCTSEINILGEYVEVRNNPLMFKVLQSVCDEAGFKCIQASAKLVGEDFGFFTEKWSGLLFWLGTGTESKEPEPLHSSTFFPDSESIEIGLEIMFKILLRPDLF